MESHSTLDVPTWHAKTGRIAPETPAHNKPPIKRLKRHNGGGVSVIHPRETLPPSRRPIHIALSALGALLLVAGAITAGVVVSKNKAQSATDSVNQGQMSAQELWAKKPSAAGSNVPTTSATPEANVLAQSGLGAGNALGNTQTCDSIYAAYTSGVTMTTQDFSDWSSWLCNTWFPSGIGSQTLSSNVQAQAATVPVPAPSPATRTCDSIYSAFTSGVTMTAQDFSDWSSWACNTWYPSGIGSTNGNVRAQGAITSPSTNLLVPLYMYPDTVNWPALADAKRRNPSVPITAIFNPSSGPGASQDSTFVSAIATLRSTGITLLGYVPTTYGARAISDIQADIYKYAQWYQPDGIFFDEMASVSGFESYYATIGASARSAGMPLTIGNPGTGIQASYNGVLSAMIIYEGAGLPSSTGLPSWTTSAAKNSLGVVSYGVSFLDAAAVKSVTNRVGYFFATGDDGANPYDSLPSYLDTLVSTLAG